jgi:FtsH-binding integral membrane protein
MTDNRTPTTDQLRNPYAANPAAPAGQVMRGVGAAPSTLGVKPDARLANAFLSQAFLWMFAGLLVTAGIAYFVQSNPRLLDFARGSGIFLIFAQFMLVVAISGAIRRINATTALALFFIFAATVGLTTGFIVSLYTKGSVATAFVSAAAMFGAAAIYGHVTKRSLARLGGILFMGLVGLIVAMVINWFVASTAVTWLISIVGVVLFTALTAYHVQRIQSGDLAAATGSMEKGAVIGALSLYLDFINLFFFMLRLSGGRS